MTEIFIALAIGLVCGFGAGLIVANKTASVAEKRLVQAYEEVIRTLHTKVVEARSRVAKRRQLASWTD